MKLLKLFSTAILVMSVASCATNPKPSSLPDVTENSTVDSAGEPLLPGETSEKDLEALNNESPRVQDAPTTNATDEFAQQKQNEPQPQSNLANGTNQSSPPLAEPEPQLAPPASLAPISNEKPATITGLDFDANLNGGTVNVKTNQEVSFTTRKNEKNNQFIIELQNTIVPSRFKRPYVTKDFPGAITSIQAYQAKGEQRIARIVVQLREPVEPAVAQNANTINISASGMLASADQQTPSAPERAEGQAQQAQAEEPTAGSADGQIMTNKSFDSFLLGQNKFYGKNISIEVTNQDVREVFKFISEESGLNIVLDEDVVGKATMKLKRVPWDQALAILLQSKQLGYIRNGSILRVATLRTLKSESTAARDVMDAQRNLQNVKVQIIPVSYAKAEDLAAQLKDLLSGRGKATADKRTNTIVVTDIPEVLSKVKALIGKLDTQTPQVLVEAKIIEARDTFARVVGVNWQAANGSVNMGQGQGGNQISFQPSYNSNYIHSGTNASLGLSLSNLDIVGNLTTTLQMLETDNQIRVISSPRIIVLDRVEATIEQTTQIPITTTTITAVGNTVSTTFQDLKLQLRVTPQITVDGGVIMNVNIQRDIRGQSSTTSASGAVEVGKRTASTQVLIENGDTVAIGGIYQSDANNSTNGIPWLSKIPLLGWLFKSNEVRKDKNELVILLTPRILNRDKAFVRNEGAM